MGVERYKLLYPRGEVTPGHFEADRFFDERPTDSNIPQSQQMAAYNRARAKLASARYIGDKVPVIFKFYRQLAEKCPGARYVFIYRDPFEVAASWDKRAGKKRPGWPSHNDHIRSAHVWNQSLRRTLAAARTGMEITTVSYHALIEWGWLSTETSMRELLSRLELELSDDVRQALAAEWRRCRHLRAARTGLGAKKTIEVQRLLDVGLARRFFEYFGTPEGEPSAIEGLLKQAEVRS